MNRQETLLFRRLTRALQENSIAADVAVSFEAWSYHIKIRVLDADKAGIALQFAANLAPDPRHHLDVAPYERIGGWVQSATGRRFWPLDLRPEDVHLQDIAISLSRQCRFLSHTSRFLSVAEHSVNVSRVCPPEYARAGLMHDAAEAYLGDIVRPIKELPCCRFYMEAERRAEAVIFAHFGLPPELSPVVRKADDAVLGAEATQLMRPLLPGWRLSKPANIRLSRPADDPAALFLDRFAALFGRERLERELAERWWADPR